MDTSTAEESAVVPAPSKYATPDLDVYPLEAVQPSVWQQRFSPYRRYLMMKDLRGTTRRWCGGWPS